MLPTRELSVEAFAAAVHAPGSEVEGIVEVVSARAVLNVVASTVDLDVSLGALEDGATWVVSSQIALSRIVFLLLPMAPSFVMKFSGNTDSGGPAASLESLDL